MLLSEMKENEKCEIVSINNNCELKKRLLELGLFKGQTVECKNISLNRSPIAYQICSSKLAIRKNDANKIEVNLI